MFVQLFLRTQDLFFALSNKKFKINKVKLNSIHEHLNNCSAWKHDYSIHSFRVIDGGNSDMSVSIKEAMHIKLKRPTLNKQLFNLGSSFVLGIF